MTVVGTVGHIDHGKTALLRALTGIEADRLPEERRRGMTIDVGYAHLETDAGASIDFVDLPGHRDLTGNFLVGVGEIDAALLVIAADEGAQAQTFEHLDILAAYGISAGLAVVTKLDLVADGERDEVMAMAAQLLDASVLRGAPLFGVSSRTGEGIEELRRALALLEAGASSGPGSGSPRSGSARIAVDRVFGSPGRGTVVTGTLRAGGLANGDVVRIEPDGGTARIRGIQVHGAARASVEAGGRVALNLASVDRSAVRRGSVVIRGRAGVASQRMLVAMRLVAPRTPAAERHVVLHIGTDRVSAALQWLGSPEAPRSSGADPALALLTASRPVAAAHGDRLVLRIPSPPQLYAGGFLLDPSPPAISLRALRERLPGPVPEPNAGRGLLAALIQYRRVMSLAEFASAAEALGLGGEVADLVSEATLIGPIVAHDAAVAELRRAAVAGDGAPAVDSASDAGATLGAIRGRVSRLLRRYGGIPPDVTRRAAAALVEQLFDEGRLQSVGDLVIDTAHAGEISSQLRAAESQLLRSLSSAQPPALSRAAEAAGLPMAAIAGLVSAGRLVRLAPDVGYAAETYEELVAMAVEMARRGELSAAAFRDAVGTSRRTAIVLLDAMAQAGIIRREGTGHVLGPRAPVAGLTGPDAAQLATSREM